MQATWFKNRNEMINQSKVLILSGNFSFILNFELQLYNHLSIN